MQNRHFLYACDIRRHLASCSEDASTATNRFSENSAALISENETVYELRGFLCDVNTAVCSPVHVIDVIPVYFM